MLRKSLIVSFLFLFFVLLAGCSGMMLRTNRDNAFNEYMNNTTNEYVYQRSLDEIWPQVRQLLFAKGYSVKNSDDRFIVETEWKEIGDSERRRYMITGIEVNEGMNCRVQFLYYSEDVTIEQDGKKRVNVMSERDLDAERELISMIEPDRYERMRQEANHYAYKKYPDPSK